MKTHGLSGTPIYAAWSNMIHRCYHPTHDHYRFYGARGIMVCDRWLSPENFIEDMGPKPIGMTLERVDVNLDYTPQNCTWIPAHEQASNRRDNRFLTMADGRKVTCAQAAREIGVTEKTIRQRLSRHGTIYNTRKWTRNQ